MSTATASIAHSTGPGDPAGPIYRLENVSRTYGSGPTAVDALDAITLRIERGELVAVTGASGSGKSTLLQLLGGLDRPTSGSIDFEGRELGRLGDDELTLLRLERIGFVFQQFNLIPTLSAQENVEVAIAPTGAAAPRRVARARELLARVGLGPRADHLPSQLSGGEQQRVAIARSLANGPDVVLADEPTGNLDSANGDAILGLLRELWEQEGLTVVLITHDRAVAAAAPRRVALADGRLADEHPPGAAPLRLQARAGRGAGR
jgi:putative ABC transport system ATP-binding protein